MPCCVSATATSFWRRAGSSGRATRTRSPPTGSRATAIFRSKLPLPASGERVGVRGSYTLWPHLSGVSSKEECSMKSMKAGVTKAGKGIDSLSWNILGQTYVPKALTESAFSWHALLPPGTFVPPHIHTNQDEFIYVLEGKFDLILDGKEQTATAGDFIRLPMKIMHGLFNKSDQPI